MSLPISRFFVKSACKLTRFPLWDSGVSSYKDNYPPDY
jgi:hypothetical protein